MTLFLIILLTFLSGFALGAVVFFGYGQTTAFRMMQNSERRAEKQSQ